MLHFMGCKLLTAFHLPNRQQASAPRNTVSSVVPLLLSFFNREAAGRTYCFPTATCESSIPLVNRSVAPQPASRPDMPRAAGASHRCSMPSTRQIGFWFQYTDFFSRRWTRRRRMKSKGLGAPGRLPAQTRERARITRRYRSPGHWLVMELTCQACSVALMR